LVQFLSPARPRSFKPTTQMSKSTSLLLWANHWCALPEKKANFIFVTIPSVSITIRLYWSSTIISQKERHETIFITGASTALSNATAKLFQAKRRFRINNYWNRFRSFWNRQCRIKLRCSCCSCINLLALIAWTFP